MQNDMFDAIMLHPRTHLNKLPSSVSHRPSLRVSALISPLLVLREARECR